ncbi:4'-phosphopantetheinyl transferase family protein [Aquincola tertiaricarbonis]|uniref:4'-phosphopantetheinyl transferase family protein n=1 Tax=Aquincola tertiaricarbonis TaxID=391953 RepID=UPI0006980A98|nr:4'-phosphopantetheinyl transferase superfamily protein [Aquincola tertiaricarbonis]
MSPTGPAARFEPARLQAPPPLAEGQLHLWRLHLPSAPAWLAVPLHSLSPDEAQRASRLVFPALRRAWQAARALQRAVLGAYLDCPPQRLRFRPGPGGKPLLAGGALAFNLSHSGDAVLLGITRGLACGVDLEALRPSLADTALAEACLGPQERRAWHRLRPAQRPRALLQAWTRKEAWLKCTGQGLRDDPRRLQMPWLTQRQPHAFRPPPASGMHPLPPAGVIGDLPLGTGFVGAWATAPAPTGWRGLCLGWPSD